MAAAGEIRENPGGRRLLVLDIDYSRSGPRGHLASTLQLNGQWRGQRFGVPTVELDSWELLATLPPERASA
jgi:hypothetical protein